MILALLLLVSSSLYAFTLTIDNQTGHTIYISQALPYSIPFSQITTGKQAYFVPTIPDTIQLATINRLGIMIRYDITKCSNSGPSPSCWVEEDNPGVSATIRLK